MEDFIDQEYFNLISEPEAKFILDHGEKQLEDILDTSLLIVNRSTTLLTLTVGLIVGLIGFSINRYEVQHQYENYFLQHHGARCIIMVALVVVMNFIPKSYLTLGAEPKDFFVDRVFNKRNADYRLTAITLTEYSKPRLKSTIIKR